MKRTKHIYKRFFSLRMGQSFFIRRGKLAVKDGFASYREHAVEAKTAEEWGKRTPKKTIAPWRRVRTLVPVKLHPPSGILRNCSVDGPTGVGLVPAILHTPGGGKYPVTLTPEEVQADVMGISSEVLERPISDYEIHLRDPMDQDHTPEKLSDEQQRTL